MIATGWQIALGGAAGALCRHATVVGAQRLVGPDFPLGIAIVNVLGSFLGGIIIVVLSGNELERYSPLLITGFLGGYTTYSAYSLEFWKLYDSGRLETAFVFAAGSALLALMAVFLGIALARSFGP
ncbi:MAG: CrcB family protein [Rhodobacteraceae bacterium]|nr:CrcB family protein [Paracoccaceae bacterium]